MNRSEFQQRRRDWPRWGAAALLGLVAVQALFAVVWALPGWATISTYGDSATYVQYASTGKIDAWRGVLYPLFLRGAMKVSREHFVPVCYAVQLLLLVVAVAYFTVAVFERRFAGGARAATLVISLPVGAMLAAITDPLLLHFSLAMMPDALATSFVLCMLASTIELVRNSGRTRIYAPAAILTISAAALACVRAEKVYLAAVPLFVAAVLLTFCSRRENWPWRRRAIAIGVTLSTIAVMLGVAKGSRRLMQQVDYVLADPHNVRILACCRLSVYGRFEELWPSLSPQTQAAIPRSEAAQIDSMPAQLAIFLTRLLNQEPVRARAVMNDIIRTSLKKQGGAVAGNMFLDFGCYLLPPLGFYVELATHPRDRSWSYWTYQNLSSRRCDADGRLTRCYFAVSGLRQLIEWSVIIAVLVRSRVLWQRLRQNASALAVLLSFYLASTAMFSLLWLSFHIRYGLPIYAMMVIAANLTCMSVLCGGPGDAGKEPGHAHAS